MMVIWKTVICLLLTVSVLDNVTATCPDTHTESWKKKNENCSDGKKYHCQYDAETQLKIDFCAAPLQCEAGKRAALHSEKETISCEECGPDMYQPESKWSYKFIHPNCDGRVELCPENTLVCKETTSTQNNLCKCDHTAGYIPETIQDCGCFDPRTSLCHCIQSDCREDEILSEAYKCIPAGNSSSSSPFEITTEGNERSSQIPEPKRETFIKVGLPVICVVGALLVVVVGLVMMKRKKIMCFQNQNSETSATNSMIFCNCCYNEKHSTIGMAGGNAKTVNVAGQVEGGVGNTDNSFDKHGTTPNSEVDAKVERDGEGEGEAPYINNDNEQGTTSNSELKAEFEIDELEDGDILDISDEEIPLRKMKRKRSSQDPARPINIIYNDHRVHAPGAYIGVIGDDANVRDLDFNTAPTQTPNLCDDNDITTDGDQEAEAPLVDKDDL